MPIVHWSPQWDPFQEFEDMIRDLHPTVQRGFIPQIDIFQKDGKVIIESPLQGISPDDLDISIENDVLTIEGHTEKKKEVDDKNYYRREVRYGSFHRSIPLPAAVQGDKAEAEYEDGVLRITVPLVKPKAEKKPLKVKIAKKDKK